MGMPRGASDGPDWCARSRSQGNQALEPVFALSVRRPNRPGSLALSVRRAVFARDARAHPNQSVARTSQRVSGKASVDPSLLEYSSVRKKGDER